VVCRTAHSRTSRASRAPGSPTLAPNSAPHRSRALYFQRQMEYQGPSAAAF